MLQKTFGTTSTRAQQWGRSSSLTKVIQYRSILYVRSCLHIKPSNPTCTGRYIWCRIREDVGLGSVKHIANCPMGMKIIVEKESLTNYTGVGLYILYCMNDNYIIDR